MVKWYLLSLGLVVGCLGFGIKTDEGKYLLRMYVEEVEEKSLESRALEQASKHLEMVYELGFDSVMQERHIALAYAYLMGAGKGYEAKIVAKMAKLEDEVERSLLALWVLGARLELPNYREQWIEQARDSWCLMVVGSALQNVAMLG